MTIDSHLNEAMILISIMCKISEAGCGKNRARARRKTRRGQSNLAMKKRF